jgi:hypothetical protein
LDRDAQDSTISFLERPGANSPVGMALLTSWAYDGATLWKLMIGGSELPGALRDLRSTIQSGALS